MPVALVSDCMCVICDRRKTQPVLTLPLLMPVVLVSDCIYVYHLWQEKDTASVNSTSVDACSIGKWLYICVSSVTGERHSQC